MKPVTRNEFMALLNVRCPSVVFRDIVTDEPVEHHGWTVMRTKVKRGYQYLVIKEGPCLNVPDGYTATELAAILGCPSGRLYGEAKWHNDLQRICGQVIERSGPHQKARRYKILPKMPARGKVKPAPKPKPEPKDPVCVVCEGTLTPRRTVRINGYDHCVLCNRRAFVDGCYETRKKLGI